jgi:uncharacterized protein YfaS (alpha-2-macroglobulin family)
MAASMRFRQRLSRAMSKRQRGRVAMIGCRKALLVSFFLSTALISGYSSGTTEELKVSPNTFLRGYDPITVSFDSDIGPAGGGPLDGPQGVLRIVPSHPGEYRWLDARTLQFLPTIPWPGLRSYEIAAGEFSRVLITLMVPPESITPAAGSSNLEPLRTVALSFRDPLGKEELAEMVSFEVRPLPGIGDADSTWLTSRDFSLKDLGPPPEGSGSRFMLTFANAIEYGRHITMHLRLSLDPSVEGSLARYTFSTRPEFRISAIGSGYLRYPVATKGSVYSQEQAINAGTGNTPLFLEFTENIAPPSVETVKKLVRFEPAVRNFGFNTSARRLYLYFEADREVPYKVSVFRQDIHSTTGRSMAPLGQTSVYFYYRQLAPFVRWERGQGLLELKGPQVFPMEGRATDNVDLRIYRIDPLNRNFWPFPAAPVVIDERRRPPMPGEEPAYATQLAEQIRLIGSPDMSEIADLPMTSLSGRTRWGLDLAPHLSRIAGPNQPAAYLLGYRVLGPVSTRQYVRILVTDLCLTTVEEENAVNFIVTSLDTAEPVAGAKIDLEADFGGEWRPLVAGITDSDGWFIYRHEKALAKPIQRIVVTKDEDVLVLDPANPPPHFQNNHWFGSSSRWLSWLTRVPRREKEKPRHRGYLLTERPIYRPEEPVHILGFVRQRRSGRIEWDDPDRERSVIVTGPGRSLWTFPVELTESGRFYVKFSEEDLATGEYSAILRDEKLGQDLDSASFKVESYRIPRFEINISGPDRVALDEPFELVLTADYYAGGRVVGQPVTWQITQYPFRVSPPRFPGYLFSTDDRFSGGRPFRAIGSGRKTDVTDENGSSRLAIDPSLEEDGRPRIYAVEGTVRGADTQTVTAVKNVLALPPFVLGLKVDRFLLEDRSIRPEILVLDHNEQPLPGKPIHLRLYQRQWHSYLKESDFTTGEAKYITDVVDQIVYEDDLISTDGPMVVELPTEESGIYVVELQAKDNLGRLQRVQADLYVSGDTPVAWRRTQANVFETSLDKDLYSQGETAEILLKSPFQSALALVVVEGPKDNSYHWVDIRNGQALFSLPVTDDMTPRLPVHTLLMRGRLPGTGGSLQRGDDLGKPVAMANTTWVSVAPRANQARLTLEHPRTNLPGSRMKMSLRLTEPDGTPLDGEVSLWLVDRAVLALGVEKPIDPLDAFIDPVQSYLRIRETRNEAVGNLPVEEIPGGAGMEELAREPSLFEKTTVRRQFKSVPYFNPGIEVKEGFAEVFIDLPDNLTDFAVRAVAAAGESRFGTEQSVVSVRLPVIIQSALPRFVRPGDSFVAGGIGRVVEGEGGAGLVQLEVEGLEVEGLEKGRILSEAVIWEERRAQRLFFPFKVPTTQENEVTVRLGVERTADEARDAFEIKLPVRRDTEHRSLYLFVRPDAEEPLAFPIPTEAVRRGTLEQTVLLTYEPALLRMLAGMNMLVNYGYLCTEQLVSRVYPAVALQKLFKDAGLSERYDPTGVLEEVMTYLESTHGEDGLFAYWPGSRGYVGLTAYVVEFLSVARDAGLRFDEDLLQRSIRALKEALRSDYPGFVPGHSFRERVEALVGLAAAGFFDEAYAQDLIVGALNSDLYTKAKILSLFLARGAGDQEKVKRLLENLMDSVIFKLEDGEEAFVGLEYRTRRWGGLTLSSETKTLAAVTQSLYRADPESSRTRLMVDEIVFRADANGWGSTNANAAALLALGEVLRNIPSDQTGHRFEVRFDGRTQRIDTRGKVATEHSDRGEAPGVLELIEGEPSRIPYAWVRVGYIPDGLGDTVSSSNEGFIVERELLEIDPLQNGILRRNRAEAGARLALAMDTVVEEHIRLTNPEERFFVAVRVPFAAGFELMNPELVTAPKEAMPIGRITLKPTYARYEDDQVTFYYDSLPEGTYDFYFRLKASFKGSFAHPPARAELMYDSAVRGRSDGTRIVIRETEER